MTTEELAKFTSEQKRIRIAELCGWKPYTGQQTIAYMWAPGHISNVVPSWTRTIDNEVDFRIELPDYLNDLNASHDMEKILRFSQWQTYVDNIIDSSPTRNGDCQAYAAYQGYEVCHATAAQRSDAFLLTL